MTPTLYVRLDYVFVNQNRAAVKDCTVVFTEPVPLLHCSYSDHFGIHVKLQILSNGDEDGGTKVADNGVLSKPAVFDTIDRISERYLARELRQSRYRIGHFFASLFVFIAFLIGQWWVQPKAGHFVILLATVLVVVTGTINGLIGFIFGKWEINALREFISEVRLAKGVYLEGSNGV
jgi:sphingomyelin phosphodiesterase 2